MSGSEELKFELKTGISNVTAASEMGGRSYQEDRYVATTISSEAGEFDVMAIMDGHGGEEVSQLIKDTLTELLRKAIDSTSGDLTTALTLVTEALNTATSEMRAGSTFSLVVVNKDTMRAHVAVLGDSPVIILDDKSELNLSPDHNAISNPAEREAAIARGAEFDGVYLIDPYSGSGLQMARALGDRKLDGFLSRDPEIYEVGLNDESFIIVASDGVIDPQHEMTEIEIERLAALVAEGASADDLVADAIGRRTGDNVTAVVWRAA